MAHLFDKYPELMLYDATYKLNTHNMPLILQLIIDGNGETEICSLFVCQSEALISVGAMVDTFQFFNPSWTKTRVILGDKDFADRGIYKQKYPDAVLQICLYHVLVTFSREITTQKTGITKEQRTHVLEILERLTYSTSSESYDSIYKELVELDLEKVTQYFNNNWHVIKDEWTIHGRNQYANFLTTTNNRTESTNQKIKMISRRNANLLSFFENVYTSVAVFASERNIRTIKTTMRVPRRRFESEDLAR